MATSLFVSVSYICALRLVKVSGRKLPFVSNCKEAYAAKEKFAGALEKPVDIELLNAPLAVVSGLSLLNCRLGTRGMVKANTMPTLKNCEVRCNGVREGAYAIQKPNNPNASVFLVKHPPKNPFSSRVHDCHLACTASLFFSLLAAFVMSRISDAFHSGPRAGTVTISTGPVVLAPSSCLLSGTCLYLRNERCYKGANVKQSDLVIPCVVLPKRGTIFRPSIIEVSVNVPSLIMR